MKISELLLNAEKDCQNLFSEIEKIALNNQKKVLDAFRKNRISTRHFNPSTGYGYGDDSRDMLYRLYADIWGAESAIVSPLISSGTHALTIALFGLLKPGDSMLCVTGTPYDTLKEVIHGENNGSLQDNNINYSEIDLLSCGDINIHKVVCAIQKTNPKLIMMTRSKGYAWRKSLSILDIKKACEKIKKINPNVIILVDNCYGEFAYYEEPTNIGADVIAGSLIKNPGGGIAPTGGYLAGKSFLIDKIANRFISPATKTETGSYFCSYMPFYQGLFLAPATVASALKGSVLFGYCFEKIGYSVNPKANELPTDIIRAIKFNSENELISFIQGIQYSSPVDSFVLPIADDMPGYDHKVIMAAGTFVQGSSIELSADSPIKEPYIAYLQGGLTYEHCKIALIESLKRLGYSY